MFLILAIFLGLFFCPMSFLNIPETAKPGHLVFNHTRGGSPCIIPNTTTHKNYFFFNDTQLFIKETPDLETDKSLCENNIIEFKYACIDGQTNPPLTFTEILVIVNVDEFALKFDIRQFDTFVNEEQPSGTKVKFLNGTDIDLNNYVSDEDCGDDRFKFKLQVNQLGTFKVSGSSVVTNKVIDYEKGENMYNLTLFAENDRDDGSQAKTASSFISINITDIDDMNPIFNYNEYTLHVIEENSSFVNVDLTVIPHDLAHDQDMGINQALIYSLPDKEQFMSINGVTGAISLNKILDREQKASYSFQMKAVQNDTELRFAVSKLNLIVDDINDNHAVFNSTILHVNIQENLAKGSVIVVVEAFDADEGKNSKFGYVISDGALAVNPSTGIVTVFDSSALDRETNEELTFQISTIPETKVINNNPCPNCNITLNVKLIDVNDNDPIFLRSHYVFTVENNVSGERLGQVSAKDADKAENALVKYMLESQTTDFSVNDTSGEITLASQTALPTTILVKACDSTINPSLRRCSTVQVNVQSKDNSSGTGHDIVADILENLPAGSFVAELPFYSNQLQFELQNNDNFKLIKNIIKTKVTLDRENKQYYSLQLHIFNGSKIQERYFVNITVHDVNDNAPKFVQDKYVFHLKEDMTTGSCIGKVEATDEDDTINANVTYYLEGHNSKYFSISTTDGKISLLRMPDIGLTQQFLSLVVRAADSGQPSLQNLTTVQIQVGLDNGALRIQVGAEKNTIVSDQKNYERSLTNILGVETVIKNISTYGAGSVIYISATNVTDGSEIPVVVLSRLVEYNMAVIQELFMRQRQSHTDENGMSTEAIALIAVACVLFVGSILLTAVTYYKFKRYQRLQRLVHNLSRKNSIYETQETSIAIEDEISDYDGHDSISTQNLITDDKPSSDVPNGHVAGVDNPSYMADEPITEAQNSFQDTEPELDYLNAELDQPAALSDTPDIPDNSAEKDYNEPDIDDANHEQTEEPVNDDLVNNHVSTDGVVNDDVVKNEEIRNETDEDLSLNDTDKSGRFFVPTPPPPPPPLPNILPPLSKSLSSSELTNTTKNVPADAPKTTHYDDVLLELSATVKKRSVGEEGVYVEPVIDPESKGVPKVHNENQTDGLTVIDLDEAGPEDLNTNPNSNHMEEPEPDYAKRVRFNEDDVKDQTNPSKVNNSEDSDDEQSHLGHDLRNSEEIKSPNDSVDGESGTFVFGQVEITEF